MASVYVNQVVLIPSQTTCGAIHEAFQGPDSMLKCRLTSIGNPIVDIRRS